MHLVAPLISGVRNAENGTAEIYIRGTNTLQAYYSDFEGTTTVAGGIATLDAYGRAAVYVDRLVRVVVKDSAGATVVTFVAGAAAEAVEVTNTAFTGTDYSGAPTAVGKPTTVDAVLSAWLTSAGSFGTDFGVTQNGARVSLSTLASQVALNYFNVKAYGAIGDGTTDDTTAINSAKTAAVAVGGGIIYFPPGTYRYTANLTIQSGISLLGAGIGVSTLTADHASNGSLTIASSTYRRSISGLTIAAKQTNSGDIIILATGSKLSITQCSLGSSLNTANSIRCLAAVVTDLYVEDCLFPNVISNAISLGSSNVTACRINRCIFTMAATTTIASAGVVESINLTVTNCTFNNAACTAGTYYCVSRYADTSLDLIVQNCSFSNAGGATVTGIYAFGNTGSINLWENGNRFGSSITAIAGPSAATATDYKVYFGSRVGRVIQITNNTTPLDITAYVNGYDTIIIHRSTNTDQVVNVTTPNIGYTETTIYIENGSGGNIANETVAGAAAVGVLNGVKKMWKYRYDAFTLAYNTPYIAGVVST